MSTATLELRSVDQLIDHTFIIPSYQRGYRWSPVEVRALLDDLESFLKARREGAASLEGARSAQGEFYCLQPIVVLPRGSRGGRPCWELIDGQQRLTTLFLILQFLRRRGVRLRGCYQLSYDTRQSLYLADPGAEHQWETPDTYYMHQAYLAIEAWFDARGAGSLEELRGVLLRPRERNTRVIWYQLPATSEGSRSQIDAFIRLNAGKIRLTNAELIRALLLKADNFPPGLRDLKQIKLAQEWDQIEQRLQDDSFWFFLYGGPSPYTTRVDHLFHVHLEAEHAALLEGLPASARLRTFLAYQELERRQRQEGGGSISGQWEAVKRLAMRLEEWHQDRVLYHLIGLWLLLRARGGDSASALVDLLARRDQHRQPHQGFEEGLKADLFRRLIADEPLTELTPERIQARVTERLDEVQYGGWRVRPLLLLFNVATLLRNGASRVRFPFDLFQLQEWDIEHIRSVDSWRPGRPQGQKDWLRAIIEHWGGRAALEQPEAADRPGPEATAELVRRAVHLLGADPYDAEGFDALYDDVLEHLGESEPLEANHAMGNLTLLDAHTNRSYRNAPFPVKRRRILALDMTGTFVPRCTTNVFLKYYSRRLDQLMIWTDACAASYQASMAETIAAFFTRGGHRPEEVHLG